MRLYQALRRLLPLVACLSAGLPVLGQSDSTQIQLKLLTASDLLATEEKAQEEIVTATRSGSRSLEDFPITVYVVSKEDILRNGYTTLVDVLKSVPGIKTSKPGSGPNGEMFLMRGLVGNQYTKILIDGIPVQPSVTGTMPIGEQLPIAQAEKIEIIYGPAATVYGSDAIAGVVNIITQQVGQGTLAQVNAVGGRDGYRHLNFLVGGKLGRNRNVLSYSLYANTGKRDDMNIRHQGYVFNSFDYAAYNVFRGSFSSEQIEQLRNLPPEQESVLVDLYRDAGFGYYEGGAYKPEIGRLPQQSYLLGATVRFRNFQAGYHEMYRRDHSTLGRNPLVFSYASPRFFSGERIQRSSLSYSNRWDKVSLTLNASYLRYRTDLLSSFGNNYFHFHGEQSYVFQASDDIFLEGLLTYRPNENWDLLMGLTRQWSSNMPSTSDLAEPFDPAHYRPFSPRTPPPDPLYGNFGYNPVRYGTSSAFFQGFYHKNRWSFLAGFRLVWAGNFQTASRGESGSILFNDFTNSLSPRLGALYKLSASSSLRLSLSTGFRLPPTELSFASLALPGIDANGESVPGQVNYQLIPSEGLSPEISNSTEIGYRYLFSNKIYADVALFSTVIFQRINSQMSLVDRERYPDAVLNFVEPDGSLSSRARQWVNSPLSESRLVGLQLLLRARDLMPRYRLGVEAALQLAGGGEVWASGEALDGYRGVPQRTLQLNVSFEPMKHLYVRVENVWASRWYRRNLQSAEDLTYPYAHTPGYFVTDLTVRGQLSKQLQAFVRVLNLFNSAYAGIGSSGLDVDLYYTPQLLRNIQIGLTFRK